MHVSVKTIVSVCIAVMVASILLAFAAGGGPGGFLSLFEDARTVDFIPDDGVYKDSPGMDFLSARGKPVIKAKNNKARAGEPRPASDFVESVTDADGADLAGALKAGGGQVDSAGVFRADAPGNYIVTLSVTDSYGVKAVKSICIAVEY